MNQVKKVGRKPIAVEYKKITYINIEYVVGIINSSKGIISFIIDGNDYEKIVGRSWHVSSAGYIVSYCPTGDGIKQLLLHRFVMNLLDFPGRGATESIDHINRNPLDNRKENLRIVSQSEQNINQKKKPRNIVELPENCGIFPNDIPRHIWYIKPNGSHGDRFAIELKTENILWKSSSSKKLTLKEKLQQTNQKLDEYYLQYPYLNPNVNDTLKHAEILSKSFKDIIEISLN